MEKIIEEYENNTLKIVNEVLFKFREKFLKKNIVIKDPFVRIHIPEIKNYTSEIEIWFNKNNDLIDIIEFYVIKNRDFWIGDEEEFKQWLVEILDEVFNDN